ncbi:hypothetical protein [Sphingobium phenoxybenzoativorans]|uniref:hypothetical protein n=1 Tax=Sphingobium phenoxybenzoativorans TaxID=1592790 RepID=UPI0008734C3C|nr:hypothetical protein [Sphingobium phenoxybenzoativorans]
MTLANIIAGIALTVWGLMLFGGVTAYRSVLGQNVAGYPNWGQFHLFLSFPGSIVAILLVGLALVNWKQRGAILLAVFSGGSLLFVLPWMTGFTGGV